MAHCFHHFNPRDWIETVRTTFILFCPKKKLCRILHGLRHRILRRSRFIEKRRQSGGCTKWQLNPGAEKCSNNIYGILTATKEVRWWYFFERLGDTILISSFDDRTEKQLKQNMVQLQKAKEVLLRNIPGSDKLDMFRWRTAAPDELWLRPSFRSKDSIPAAVEEFLPQSLSPESQKLYGSFVQSWWSLHSRTLSHTFGTSLQKRQRTHKRNVTSFPWYGYVNG